MTVLRRLLQTRGTLMLAIAALALAMRALVPAGYMVAPQGTSLTVTICADASGGSVARQVAIPAGQKQQAGGGEHAGTACGFGALAMAATGGADPVLLAAALAVVALLGLVAAVPATVVRAPRLRPPLRAPPAFA